MHMAHRLNCLQIAWLRTWELDDYSNLDFLVTIQLRNRALQSERSRIQFSISSLLKYENRDIAFGYFDRNSSRENCSNSFRDTFSSTDFELFNWFASGRTFAIPNNDTLPLVFRCVINFNTVECFPYTPKGIYPDGVCLGIKIEWCTD